MVKRSKIGVLGGDSKRPQGGTAGPARPELYTRGPPHERARAPRAAGGQPLFWTATLATRTREQLLHRAELVEQHGLGRDRRRAVLCELREEPAVVEPGGLVFGRAEEGVTHELEFRQELRPELGRSGSGVPLQE